MSTRNLSLAVTVVILLMSVTAVAHDYVPAPPQESPIVLRGGSLYTVSNGVIDGADILFDNGQIVAIGVDLEVPEGTVEIDVSGKRIYPGLIEPYTTIGLIEIGEVRATNDLSEVGRVNPNAHPGRAFNPDSEIIPSVRSNGVTTVQVVPNGSLLKGRSCVVNLDGWTVEDMYVREVSGLHLNWPGVKRKGEPSGPPWESNQPDRAEEDRRELRQVFDEARAYYVAKQAGLQVETDLRWESMLPVFAKELPVVVAASDVRQIEEAVEFAEAYDLRMILAGAGEADLVADLLREKNIPVILRGSQAMPQRADDGYDRTYALAGKLEQAGVRFCLSTMRPWGGTATGARNLPFQAGFAAAYGLSREEALRSVTLSAAEVLGVEDQLGSLEVGKRATLIVSKGDVLDPLPHEVELMFIDGRRIDLDNKHKELYRKYRAKHVSE